LPGVAALTDKLVNRHKSNKIRRSVFITYF
jgi:hypothetical protein